MKTITLCILTLLLIPLTQAAIIHGNIYDQTLQRVTGSIITINSTPQQTIVVEESEFTIELPLGTFELKVQRIQEGRFIEQDSHTITITEHNNYQLDFILFPELIENEEPPTLTLPQNTNTTKTTTYTLILLVILTTIALLILIKKKNTPKRTITPDKAEELIINILKQEKRITQKELRTKVPYSEAKISLVLADLESQKRIRKIKQGRSNIIIYEHNTSSQR